MSQNPEGEFLYNMYLDCTAELGQEYRQWHDLDTIEHEIWNRLAKKLKLV